MNKEVYFYVVYIVCYILQFYDDISIDCQFFIFIFSDFKLCMKELMLDVILMCIIVDK